MPSKVKLKIENGPLADTKFGIDERMNCIIGRDSASTICIPADADPMISRNHCMLVIDPPDVAVEDLNSRNGTLINGNKLDYSPDGELTFLKDGDKLQLGNTVISVEIESDKPIIKQEKCRKCGAVLDKNGECKFCGGVLTLVEETTGTIIMNKSNRHMFNIEGHKIISLLGKGGNGAVFLAKEEETGKQVALKVILPRTETSPETIDHFLREADTASSLKHPNIIEIRNVSYSGEIFYFSMEFCDSGSLFEYIENRALIDIEEAIRITNQMLTGLEYAHSALVQNVRLAGGMVQDGTGLVHRDIKPENIYLKYNKGLLIAKIADFGLSKAFEFAGMSGFTKTGAASGSPVFMCRNHLRNYKYAKPEVDVWATAATLYYMLTKDYPRDLRDDNNFVKMILETEPVPVKKRNIGIPNPLAELIDFALEDKPDLNFKTAADFKKALNEVAHSLEL